MNFIEPACSSWLDILLFLNSGIVAYIRHISEKKQHNEEQYNCTPFFVTMKTYQNFPKSGS
ncbi:hypothetical protein ACH2HH_002438, partial [Shigella flexneri]